MLPLSFFSNQALLGMRKLGLSVLYFIQFIQETETFQHELKKIYFKIWTSYDWYTRFNNVQ